MTRKTGFFLVLLAFSGFLHAGVLVLKNGTTIKTDGPYEIQGKMVIYKNEAGNKFSLPLKVVDFERSNVKDPVEEEPEVPVYQNRRRNEPSLVEMARQSNPTLDFVDHGEVGVDDEKYNRMNKADTNKRNYRDWHLDHLVEYGTPAELRAHLKRKGLTSFEFWVRDHQSTPLEKAVSLKKPSMVRTLLSFGADPNFKGEQGKSPVHLAVENGGPQTTEIIDVLLNHGGRLIEYDKRGKSTFYYALDREEPELVRYFLEKGADPNMSFHDGSKPLQLLTGQSKLAIAKVLLEKGANPSIPGKKHPNLLMDALAFHNDELAKALIQKGAVIERTGGEHPLEVAFFSKDYRMVQLVLNNMKLDTYDKLDTMIYSLIDTDQMQMIPILIQHGFDINRISKDGDNALCFAARRGNYNAVKTLLLYDVDKDLKGKNGITAYNEATGKDATLIRVALRK